MAADVEDSASNVVCYRRCFDKGVFTSALRRVGGYYLFAFLPWLISNGLNSFEVSPNGFEVKNILIFFNSKNSLIFPVYNLLIMKEPSSVNLLIYGFRNIIYVHM